MTLTTRLSVFFLTALGLALAGFSVTLYLLARSYVYDQADDRLDAVLNTLIAVGEIGSDGIEWKAHEHNVFLRPEGAEGQVAWIVRDDQGRWVDGSPAPFSQEFLVEAATGLGPDDETTRVVYWQGQPWQLAQRHVSPPAPPVHPALGGASHAYWDDDVKYPGLVITAGMSLQPVRAMLSRLAWALAATSLGLWLLAFFVGRWLCRRALLPVSGMAASARSMDATDLSQRLPTSPTGDELEDLGRAFNGLLDRLQESFERQRRFTGDASHQLRTPLTALLGQIEVALRRERDPAEYRRVLTAVQGQAAQLHQIVEMLLFLARADAEAKAPGLERLDLRAWLSQRLLSWASRQRGTDLRREPDPSQAVWVRVHPLLLSQALDNLLDNACKYSTPGSSITLRTWHEAGTVCLRVADQGRGIAAEDLPHLFEPFYRSPDARRWGSNGVGLGLSVAARIVAAFGGRIEVTSVLGQGSQFTVCLPQAAPAEQVGRKAN
jgi:heavy metal sensor kinase